MNRRPHEPELKDILRFIAEREPLERTLRAFPDITELWLREALVALGDRLGVARSGDVSASAGAGAGAGGAGNPAGNAPASPHDERARQPRANAEAQLSLAGLAAERAGSSRDGSHAREGRDARGEQLARHGAAPVPEKRSGSAQLAPGNKHLVINTDGASRGNPGPAGAGWVLSSPGGGRIGSGAAYLGKRTNNEAEYEAVIRALRAALELGADEISLRSDSELLIKQLTGVYKVRNERIAVLHGSVRELLKQFRRASLRHVPREENSAADAMANEAVDRGTGRSRSGQGVDD